MTGLRVLFTAVVACSSLGFEWEGRLARLRRQLASGDASERIAALDALAHRPSAEVGTLLLRAFEDPDVSVRTAAALVAGEARLTGAVRPLIEWLDEPDATVRAIAARVLGAIGDPESVPALIRTLGDARGEVRRAAVEALARWGDRRAVWPLVAHARDEAPEVRAAVATALGELGDGRATPVLLHALQDGSSDVQLAAIRALGRIGDDDAAQALALRLADDDRIARASAAALGRIPSRIALAALVEALVRPTVAPIVVEALRQRAPQDREAIARVLADALDAAEAPSHIEAIASAPSTERILAARLLGRIRAPRALPALRAMVGARDPNERLAAIDAIGAIGEPDGAASLVALLEDPDAVIRHLAARALARCAGSALLARFTERLRDPTPIDREALLLAIGGTTRRLRRNGEASAIPAELGPTLLEMAASSDRRLAATALAAIATWGDPALAAPLADRARRLPPSRRAPVATALGALDDRAAREALRAMAEAGDGDSAIVAWSRLGEHGGHADALWVLERATALRWPCSAAAAFAIARFARRGVLRPEDTSAICALGRSHDPWVRANVAIALAALGAAPCDGDGPDPLRWIDPPRSPVVRAAAARWLAAAASRGATGEAVARAALDRCTQSPLPGPAERACKNPALPPLDDVLDIVAWSADGRPVLERTLVALRLPDDSVLVTATDDAGRVLLAGVPSGPLVLDLPWSLPLEP